MTSEAEAWGKKEYLPLVVSYDQFREFLSTPSEFLVQNSRLIDPLRQITSRFSNDLCVGMKGIEETKYFGKEMQTVAEYLEFKKELALIYDNVEKMLGSKVKTVFEMEVDNWSDSQTPEYDFAKLVLQYFKFIEDFNQALNSGTKFPGQVLEMLRLQVYGNTYELAGKRVLQAAEVICKEEMNELGKAIRLLRGKGYKLAPFDIELRNGLYHGNFLIDSTKQPPQVDYGNISFDRKTKPKTVCKFSKKLSDIDLQTVKLGIFVMATSFIHAQRYLAVVNDALTKIP